MKNNKKKTSTTENKYILKSTYVFAALFMLVMGYFVYYLSFVSQKQMSNPYNKLIAKQNVTPGIIYSSDGKILAKTENNTQGNPERVYPYGEILAHAIGNAEYGQYGLDSIYSYELNSTGMNMLDKFRMDLNDESYIGNNIYSTIDMKLQQASYDAMQGYKGAVVIMDPESGEILTMLSLPSYNPNTLEDDWAALMENDDSPVLNRATQGLYTPGSIFKIFTMEAYIEEGNDDDKFTYNCTGDVEVMGTHIRCVNQAVHGKLDLMKAFAYSCNGSFINIGNQLNTEKYVNTCERLLFNSKLPIELPYSKSRMTLTDDDNDFQKAQTYFGQGETMVSPIHMALVMSAIANDGVLMEPRFVDRVENVYGNVTKEYSSKKYADLLTEEQAQKLQKYLHGVVELGSGKIFLDLKDVTAYGKTGTAQVGDGSQSNSWFVGYIEKNNKKYVISLVCEKVSKDVSPAVGVAYNILKTIE